MAQFLLQYTKASNRSLLRQFGRREQDEPLHAAIKSGCRCEKNFFGVDILLVTSAGLVNYQHISAGSIVFAVQSGRIGHYYGNLAV